MADDYDPAPWGHPYWQRNHSRAFPLGLRESQNVVDQRNWRPGGFFAMENLPTYQPPSPQPQSAPIHSGGDDFMAALSRPAPSAEPMHMPPIMDFFRRPSQPNDPTAPPLNALARFMMMRR